MSKLKILIAALILGLGLGGAYFIISNSNPALRGMPQLKTGNLDITNNNPVEIEAGGIATSTANLSEILAKKIASEVAAANPNGSMTVAGKTYVSAPKPEDLANDLFTEAQKNFNPKNLYPTINDSYLKISEDNSKQVLINYFDSFSKILINSREKIPKDLISSANLQVSDFVQVVSIYETTIKSFYDLTVPRTVLNIHKKEIELLTAGKNIYQKMANAEQDPLTAVVAVKELPNIYQEFDKLKTDLNDFLKANQLIK